MTQEEKGNLANDFWMKQGDLFNLQRKTILILTDILYTEGITKYNDIINPHILEINNMLADLQAMEKTLREEKE